MLGQKFGNFICRILWRFEDTKMFFCNFLAFKGSPIMPFFNYAFNKLRQTGALYREKKKWIPKENTFKCTEDPLEPISFHKIVSLPGLLFFGIVFSCIILAIEIIKSKLCANMLHSILSEDLE